MLRESYRLLRADIQVLNWHMLRCVTVMEVLFGTKCVFVFIHTIIYASAKSSEKYHCLWCVCIVSFGLSIVLRRIQNLV